MKNTIRPAKQLYDLTMSQESSPESHNKQSNNLYKWATQYSKYTETSQHKRQEEVLINFIKYQINKILFIFGPTGSGKHMMVYNFLNKHKIPYQKRAQQIAYKENSTENEYYGDVWKMGQNQHKIKGIREMLCQSLESSVDNQVVEIYEDFPIPTLQTANRQLQAIKDFKLYFFKTVPNSNAKIIFILNSDIYNRYYIIPKGCPPQINQINIKSYTNTELRTIAKNFTTQHPIFEAILSDKDIMDQIVQISNGDARKLLLNFFKYKMENKYTKSIKYMDKSQKAQYKLKLKNQQKFSLFHLLGKFLYAKRYDISQKKDRFFTKQQIMKSDPPFYFDPVNLYLKSGIPLSTFVDLLFENYMAKIATIEDANNISRLFSHLDFQFPEFITNKRVDSLTQQTQIQFIFQLTWGIILLNKSSSISSKSFASFRKAEYNHVMRQAKNKKQLMRKYFPFSTLSSLVRLGYIVKNSFSKKNYLISGIITKRNRRIISLKEDCQREFNQAQEQQIQKQQLQNDPHDFVKNYNHQKEKLALRNLITAQLLLDDSDIEDD